MTTVRLGIVGLGRLGMEHARTLHYRVPNAELAAVCAADPEQVAAAQAELGVALGFQDYTEMLNSAELDGVVIVSSSALHTPQIIEALEAGLHVFSEKPLGTTVEQCVEAADAVAAHPNQRFMLGFMRRYDSSYAEAKRRIQAGEIGEPFLVRAYGLDPEHASANAISFAATSGGIFLDMMIHDIDLARWFLEREVQMVHALGGSYKHPEFRRHNDVDNATALMQFADNKMGIFYAGRTAAHGYHIETEIVGTEGALRIDGVPRSSRVVRYGGEGIIEGAVQTFPERFAEAFCNEFVDFVECILEGRTPPVGVHDGVEATRVAYAATDSLRSQTPVYLNKSHK